MSDTTIDSAPSFTAGEGVRAIPALLEQHGPRTTAQLVELTGFPGDARELEEAMGRSSRSLGYGFAAGAWHLASQNEAVREAIERDAITEDQARLLNAVSFDEFTNSDSPLDPLRYATDPAERTK